MSFPVSIGPRFEIVDALVSPPHLPHVLLLFVGHVLGSLIVGIDEESKDCVSTDYRESCTEDD